MKNPNKPLQSRPVALAGLLVVLATASGCGALPTAPSLDPTATADRSSTTLTAELPSLSPVRMDVGSGSGDAPDPGGSTTPPSSVDPNPVILPTPHGPGNSDWGHSHRKPKH
jgi:hypothetical protein